MTIQILVGGSQWFNKEVVFLCKYERKRSSDFVLGYLTILFLFYYYLFLFMIDETKDFYLCI